MSTRIEHRPRQYTDYYKEYRKAAPYTVVLAEEAQKEHSIGYSSYGECFRRAINNWFCKYTTHGCYTLEYVLEDGTVLCGDCAREAYLIDREIVTTDIYFEGPVMYCEDCGDEIESAYGDPEEEEEGDDNESS